jgi:pimeloyl-ACP methyl ester carboxylesterase
MTLQLGSRPKSSLVPVVVTPDVKFVDANKLKFAYIEMGNADAPLVLLMHGYPETARCWHAVQTKIAAAGFRVIAPFMRGYPPTAFADSYSVDDIGSDVVALIDALGNGKTAYVVGHDWGASAVYCAASLAPEKITKLVAIALPHAKGLGDAAKALVEAPHFVYYQLPTAERLLWSHDFSHLDRLYKSELCVCRDRELSHSPHSSLGTALQSTKRGDG